MEIWYNPSNGQVMAVYSTTYTGSVWPNAGYLRAHSDTDLSRDYVVTVSNGRVTSATKNPNPTPPANSDGREKARAAARLAVVEKIIDEELAKPESDIPEIETLRTALGGR